MPAGLALFLLDMLILVMTWPLIFWGVTGGGVSGLQIAQAAVLAVSNLIFLYALGLYRRESLADPNRAIRRVVVIVAIAVGAGSLFFAIIGQALAPSLAVAALLTFVFCAALSRFILRALRRHPSLRPRLLIIGAGQRAWDLIWLLRSQGRHLQYEVTFVHEDSFGPIDPRLSEDPANHIIANSGDLLRIADRVFAEQIVVAPDDRRGMSLESLIACRNAGYPVFQYMTFLEKEIGRIDMKRLDVSWVLYSDGFYTGPMGRVVKRIFDIFMSLLILICTAPILLPAMAAVWLDDRGPIFYRQTRITRDGRHFRILKLRTMRVDAEAGGAVWAASNDNRITRVGNFLRRSRIDELPQLLNILAGDMSVVGPRPERPEFVEDLARQLPLYKERHAVRCGLTGWAQINYPYGASLDDARSKLSYDLYYVKKSNFFFDLVIIMQTLRVVLWPGAWAR